MTKKVTVRFNGGYMHIPRIPYIIYIYTYTCRLSSQTVVPREFHSLAIFEVGSCQISTQQGLNSKHTKWISWCSLTVGQYSVNWKMVPIRKIHIFSSAWKWGFIALYSSLPRTRSKDVPSTTKSEGVVDVSAYSWRLSFQRSQTYLTLGTGKVRSNIAQNLNQPVSLQSVHSFPGIPLTTGAFVKEARHFCPIWVCSKGGMDETTYWSQGRHIPMILKEWYLYTFTVEDLLEKSPKKWVMSTSEFFKLYSMNLET